MRKLLIHILELFGIDKERIAHYGRLLLNKPEVVENVNHESHDKRALLIYITEPFSTDGIKVNHQNFLQAREMARIIGTRGFVVDAVHFQNKYVKLHHNYDFVVGLIPRGIDVYTKHMNPGCKQVAYLTSMNLAFTSGNEEKRIEECYRRRGVKLKPRRFAGYIEPRIEQFDGTWYIGNEYNFQSYSTFKMPPSFRIKNTGYVFPWASASVDRDPKSYVYFGSGGQVHKGLDLLLEIFSQRLKDYSLYVCGCYEQEEDFAKEYHKELFETPNIHPMGFVDISSDVFKEISYKCAYSILPSCAEACAGSVLTSMSAGLVSICSKECGFEEDEVINLPNCKMDTIYDYIVEYSNKDLEWLKKKSQYSMDIVKERYSDSAFTKSVEEALDRVLGGGKIGDFVIKSAHNVWQD